MKTLKYLVLLTLVGVVPLSMGLASGDPRVKPLLQEALRLYSERQYVRALDLFKQVERIEPSNKVALDYIKSSEQRILEWESQGGLGGGKPDKKDVSWDSLLKQKATGVENINNAKDIIAARRSLVERMKNRSMSTENIVRIQDNKRGLSVKLFHDQLFLPGLQTLREEALPILSNVADLIRTNQEREVTIESVAHSNSNDPFLLYPETSSYEDDPTLPNFGSGETSVLFQDIEAIRAFILFTYLAQKSMGNPGLTATP